MSARTTITGLTIAVGIAAFSVGAPPAAYAEDGGSEAGAGAVMGTVMATTINLYPEPNTAVKPIGAVRSGTGVPIDCWTNVNGTSFFRFASGQPIYTPTIGVRLENPNAVPRCK